MHYFGVFLLCILLTLDIHFNVAFLYKECKDKFLQTIPGVTINFIRAECFETYFLTRITRDITKTMN